MDRRGGAGALAVPAWPSMARPGARARSGEGVCESAFFRVVCKGVGWAFKCRAGLGFVPGLSFVTGQSFVLYQISTADRTHAQSFVET